MKTGEKRALLTVLLVFMGVVGFTIYMEMRSTSLERSKHLTGLMQDPPGTVVAGSGTAVIPTGMNPNDLPNAEQRGATVLTLYCVQCHDLPTPLMHSAAEWKLVLDRMEQRMRARRGGMLTKIMMPPEKDWAILRDYMTANAQKVLAEDQLTDLHTKAGMAFKSTCSFCHALPDPQSHTANEWPRIVLRMQNNIRTARKTPPDSQTTELVVSYLQQHSRDTRK